MNVYSEKFIMTIKNGRSIFFLNESEKWSVGNVDEYSKRKLNNRQIIPEL
jgi:hypothetical protein